MHIAFIALGSNLDDPESKVRQGLAALAELPRTQLAAASSLYRSAPLGPAGQPDFVNAVAQLSTGLAPQALLAALLAIERRFGRERSFRNAPRTLDLDLLLYAARTIDEPGLVVPHPRMHERRFVLEAREPEEGLPERITVLLDARGLPVALEMDDWAGGGVRYAFKAWRFSRASGARAFVLRPPSGFTLVDLP